MRTVIWFFYFWISLLFLLPKMLLAEKYYKLGEFGKRDEIINKYVVMWANALLKLAGVKLNVSGKENIPDGAVLFASNHQGNFDIPILISALGAKSFISKTEVQKLPLIRIWMKHMNCIFIQRDNPRQSIAALVAAAQVIKNGYSVVIFPEGTRSRGENIGEFKGGAFKIAQKAECRIVPVAISGSYRIMESNKMLIKPAEIYVNILPPIDIKSMNNDEIKSLPDDIKRRIMQSIGEIKIKR
ncbi:MAG TPA: 1-acyl-sn-glycerol-3-phosphate acyltransferase [Ruminococcaceae bacterium]|nr:1-acyl-sn-glycerol-3-phosphate acyltransferase [Oscillospiraceae bacterium]